MKTTVELLVSLPKKAKRLALKQNLTLRDLIERGLHWLVTGWPVGSSAKTVQPSLDDVGCGYWRNVHPDKYVARLRRNLK